MGRSLLLGAALGLAVSSARAAPSDHSIGAVVGVPDGVSLAYRFRAHRLLAPHVGLAHNGNSIGVRAGLEISPAQWVISPLGSLCAGHFFHQETPGWIQSTGRSLGLDDKTLEALGYSYVTAGGGIRIGSGRIVLRLETGLSFVRATADVIKPKPRLVPPVDLYRRTTANVWLWAGSAGMELRF